VWSEAIRAGGAHGDPLDHEETGASEGRPESTGGEEIATLCCARRDDGRLTDDDGERSIGLKEGPDSPEIVNGVAIEEVEEHDDVESPSFHSGRRSPSSPGCSCLCTRAG
jgi:hypothetical protein